MRMRSRDNIMIHDDDDVYDLLERVKDCWLCIIIILRRRVGKKMQKWKEKTEKEKSNWPHRIIISVLLLTNIIIIIIHKSWIRAVYTGNGARDYYFEMVR